jgi:hypothetical protein
MSGLRDLSMSGLNMSELSVAHLSIADPALCWYETTLARH